MQHQSTQGEFFSDELIKAIKEKFYHVDIDPITNQKRLFFDNSGGSFRLKAANDIFTKLDQLPDCPEHGNKTALWLMDIQKEGYKSIETILNSKAGSIVTSLSYAKKTGKELRIAQTNPLTGGVDVAEIIKLIDKDTCLLNFMYASNISGALLDAEKIVVAARKIKSDLYIVADAVQHAPHGVIDISKVPVDGINFAPYKFFGPRGFGVGYVSERLSKLAHHKLIAKPANFWQLGSPAPAHFAAITEVVNYVCWIGEQFITATDRRTLFVEGMNRIKLHERALMHAMLEGTANIEGIRQIAGVHAYLDHKDLIQKDFIVPIGFDNIAYKKAVELYEAAGNGYYPALIPQECLNHWS